LLRGRAGSGELGRTAGGSLLDDQQRPDEGERRGKQEQGRGLDAEFIEQDRRYDKGEDVARRVEKSLPTGDAHP